MPNPVGSLTRRLVGTRLYGPMKAVQEATPRRRADRRARLAFYRQFVPDGGLVFDVGANVGNRVEAFLGLGARVVAIEPQPRCIQALKMRFGSNPDLTVLPIGLADATGTRTMQLSSNHVLSSMSADFIANPPVEGETWIEPFDVRVATLDLLIATFGRPDFCKIDVEGFEPNVLAGLTSRLPALSLEFNPKTPQSTLQCVDMLESIGFYQYAFSPGESMTLEGDGWADAGGLRAKLSTAPFGDIYARASQTAPDGP